jgi:hypothetical protein
MTLTAADSLRADAVRVPEGRRRISLSALTVLKGIKTLVIDTHRFVQVVVEGHTDDRGSASHNEDLSARRAQAVAHWLPQNGVDTNLEAKGFGKRSRWCRIPAPRISPRIAGSRSSWSNRDRAKRRPAEPAIMRNSAQHRDSITSKNITLRGKQVKKRRFPWFVQEFEGYGVEPNIWTISNASRGP